MKLPITFKKGDSVPKWLLRPVPYIKGVTQLVFTCDVQVTKEGKGYQVKPLHDMPDFDFVDIPDYSSGDVYRKIIGAPTHFDMTPVCPNRIKQNVLMSTDRLPMFIDIDRPKPYGTYRWTKHKSGDKE